MIFLGGALHLIALLLPLAGLRALDETLVDPAVVVFLAGATALYAGDATTMRWTSFAEPSPADVRARRWAACTGAVLLCLFWSALTERALDGRAIHWTQAVGAALLGLGVAIRFVAVKTLGPAFRTEIEVPDAAELVRHGVYRYVRHPSETGLLAASLGATLLLQSAVAAAIWAAALVPLTLVRLSLEERALVARFGEAYARYAADVGRLLPVATRVRNAEAGSR